MIVLVELCAVAFGIVNGLHDAGNAIAAPIVTKALRPGAAITIAAVFHIVGALTVGVAVATTVAGIVNLPAERLLPVLGAAMTGALVWNVATLWWGLPASSGHCLVGALAGAGIADAGFGAVNWGGLNGIRPVGVVGSLVWLAFTAAVAAPLAGVVAACARRALRRAPASAVGPARGGEWVTCAALAFAHGSNDSQKTMGVMALGLLAAGDLRSFSVPFWVTLVSGLALTIGTSFGGWRVVKTLGRRIYPLTPLDGLVSQTSSAVIAIGASLAGAPISTSNVVAPSVVGVGTSSRKHHVRWTVVQEIGVAWLLTLPASALLAAAAFALWHVFT